MSASPHLQWAGPALYSKHSEQINQQTGSDSGGDEAVLAKLANDKSLQVEQPHTHKKHRDDERRQKLAAMRYPNAARVARLKTVKYAAAPTAAKGIPPPPRTDC